jgi:predicted NodU family carbamoyl transferase
MTKILSLYLSHDGSITYVKDNKIVFHTQIDRYNRLKHFTFITKNICDIIINLEIDYLLITYGEENCFNLWASIFDYGNFPLKIKNKVINYGMEYHHLFHAYCALTWNKNYENILVCDGRGAKYKNDYENESLFNFKNNNLTNIFIESNKIGTRYAHATFEIYNSFFKEGKLMALSLVDQKAKKIQEEYETSMFNLIKEKNIKGRFIIYRWLCTKRCF